MRDAVDHEPTRSADALAAVMFECDRLFALQDQAFVHYVEQFQHRHVGIRIVRFVANHPAVGTRALLPPHVQNQPHYL